MPNEMLAKELDSITAGGTEYFNNLILLWQKEKGSLNSFLAHGEPTSFINSLPDALAKTRVALELLIAEWATKFAGVAQFSPLLSAADSAELRINTRKMMAALRLREYSFQEASLMNWEDQVYGVQPAGQSEREILPHNALRDFESATRKMRYLLLLAGDGEFRSVSRNTGISVGLPTASQRRDTAFIMMWMSEEHPELMDVKEGISDVFREFGITAVRADEIEHEGVITDRIVQEISSAEFLIADLTGARPNVYYEIGYAHALGKRPILYRKKDTALHFDLAGRNVPSYANISELKHLLRARLEALVGFKSSVLEKKKSD